MDNNKIIDRLLLDIDSSLKGCIYAHLALGFAEQLLNSISDKATITIPLSPNLQIEPIPINELKQYRQERLESIVLETYHGKLVQSWNNCLSDLFLLLVDLHFTNKRKFTELGKTEIKINFGDYQTLDHQIRERLINDFEFKTHKEKLKLLNKVYNPENKQPNHQDNILKNVFIRNQFQHHGGVVDDYLLKELGITRLIVLSSDSTPIKLVKGNTIIISIPEIDSFCSSLMMIGQIWRQFNGH